MVVCGLLLKGVNAMLEDDSFSLVSKSAFTAQKLLQILLLGLPIIQLVVYERIIKLGSTIQLVLLNLRGS